MKLTVEKLEVVAETLGAKTMIEQVFICEKQDSTPLFHYKVVGTPQAYLGNNIYPTYERALIVAIKYKVSTL